MRERDRSVTERERPSPLQGQVLRRSKRREVAIFLHDDALCIADFIDGQGEIVDAVTWFRFNCATQASGQARRRMALESALPLSDELVARIEALRKAAPSATQTGTRDDENPNVDESPSARAEK
jgi:hypothetical protein